MLTQRLVPRRLELARTRHNSAVKRHETNRGLAIVLISPLFSLSVPQKRRHVGFEEAVTARRSNETRKGNELVALYFLLATIDLTLRPSVRLLPPHLEGRSP